MWLSHQHAKHTGNSCIHCTSTFFQKIDTNLTALLTVSGYSPTREYLEIVLKKAGLTLLFKIDILYLNRICKPQVHQGKCWSPVQLLHKCTTHQSRKQLHEAHRFLEQGSNCICSSCQWVKGVWSPCFTTIPIKRSTGETQTTNTFTLLPTAHK